MEQHHQVHRHDPQAVEVGRYPNVPSCSWGRRCARVDTHLHPLTHERNNLATTSRASRTLGLRQPQRRLRSTLPVQPTWRVICGSDQPEADLHAFVIVHSPGGTDAAVEELLTGARPPLVTGPVRHESTWGRSDGTLVVRSWSDDASCPWRVSPAGDLIAVAGQPISMLAQGTVLDRLEADDARSFVDAGGLRNHFAALSLRCTGRDGGWLSTDPYGLHTVYRATIGERTVLGNDPQLVAIVGRHFGASSGRSESSAAINAMLGHLTACRTGFEGVEVLPLAHGVDFVEGTARLARRARDPWTVPRGRFDEALIDGVDADLTSFMVRIMQSASPVRGELTGGKDSRLILALVEDLGLAHRVDFLSYGPDDHPDVVVAERLCRGSGCRGSDVNGRPTSTLTSTASCETPA